MFRLLIVIAVVFGLAASVSPLNTHEGAGFVAGQKCPTLTVVGPAGVVRPGEVAIFAINPPLVNYDQYKFEWIVSRGTLESSQGKPWIYVRTSEKDKGTILKAEVKITGPSAECVRTLTETAEIQGGGHPIKFDEFGDLDLAACPTLSVTGPAGIVEPGKNVRFFFSAKPEKPSSDLTFIWTVSGGRIIGPNDKDILEVRPERYFNTDTTATVTVRGLPDGCPFTASDIFHVSCDPYLVIDADVSFWTQYFDLEWEEEKARLDAAVTDGLKLFPDRTIYIEANIDNKLSEADLEARIRRIKGHLDSKLAANRSFVRSRSGNRTFTNIYLVPSNAPVLDPAYKEHCLQ